MLQVAEYLLEQGADVNAQDKGGLIPLHNASSYGHLDIAALLIKYNTIVNATGNNTFGTGNLTTIKWDTDTYLKGNLVESAIDVVPLSYKIMIISDLSGEFF